MQNEQLFFIFLFINLCLPLVFLKAGKNWLYGYICINGCLLIPIAPLSIEIFTHTISVVTIAWAPIYLCTDILTEKYGKKAALSGALLSAATGFAVILILHMTLAFTPTESSAQSHEYLSTIYQYSIRMVLVGATVFMIAQFMDIYIYDYLHKKTGEKFLWLRNNASTLFTTFINNMLFWGLALGDVVDDWFASAMAAYVLTVIVALCDTPFIYLAKRIKPYGESS
jgi:uncharacterized integral membrane protein (TIGR00697 family)